MPEDRNAKFAKLYERLESLFEGDEAYTKIVDRVKALEKSLGENFDVKEVLEAIDQLKATSEKMVEAVRTSKGGLYVPGLEDRKHFNFLKAIVAVKTGNWQHAGYEKETLDAIREKAAQSIGDDSLGGYLVPDQVIPDVIAPIYTRSVLINLSGEEGDTRVTVLDGLTGGNVNIAKFNGGLIAYWLGEEDAYAQSLVDSGNITLNPRKLGVLAKLTDSMIRFQGSGFDQAFRRDFIRAAAKKIDWTVLYGTGSNNMPRGVFNSPINVYDVVGDTHYANPSAANAAVTNWNSADVLYDQLDEMVTNLEEADIDIDSFQGPISSPRFFMKLRQAKVANYTGQSTEQPYLSGFPIQTDAQMRSVIGNFGKTTQIKKGNPGAAIGGADSDTSGDAVPVLVGDLTEVIFGRWGGIEIESDEGKGTGFVSDHTFQKLRMYADVQIRHKEALEVCPNAKI